MNNWFKNQLLLVYKNWHLKQCINIDIIKEAMATWQLSLKWKLLCPYYKAHIYRSSKGWKILHWLILHVALPKDLNSVSTTYIAGNSQRSVAHSRRSDAWSDLCTDLHTLEHIDTLRCTYKHEISKQFFQMITPTSVLLICIYSGP